MEDKIINLKQNTKYRANKYFFITLGTNPTVAESITDRINDINRAYRELMRNKIIKKYILGYIKSIEIKYRSNNTFNVHLHFVIAMKSTYTKSGNYLSSKKWQALWKRALKVDYIPSVKVKLPKIDDCARIVSYIGKGSDFESGVDDYLNMDDYTKQDICYYIKSIYGRRFYSSSGILKI